ncbi:MAG: AAA family ATPase, partial [Dysgonamonadaceae bacterium]|nr:AAA family ATPase [Dysgonamonadaceae bacterium]
MEKIKRLPYGISNFESIRTENYAYVDKTRFIEQLEKETNPYQFFIRPRKFGKSLFFSMLANYYNINAADKFQSLFGDLYIGRYPTPKKNGYIVLKFNFSGISTASEEDFATSFSNIVQHYTGDCFNSYRNIFTDVNELIRKIENQNTGIQSLLVLFGATQLAGQQLFVIIDEYDHFANDLIAMGNRMGDDIYRRMVRANGLVRDFYETLKIGTSNVVDRIFITGI